MFDQMKALMKARQVQKELKETEIEAKSSNGWVTVVFSADMHVKSIVLSEDSVVPENKRELERTIERTVTEALSRAQAVAAEKTKQVMKDLNLNIPGM